jgi:hypothetical protein
LRFIVVSLGEAVVQQRQSRWPLAARRVQARRRFARYFILVAEGLAVPFPMGRNAVSDNVFVTRHFSCGAATL